MRKSAQLTLSSGFLVLVLTVTNWFTSDNITPSFIRSEVIGGLSGVGLMLVAYLWNELNPIAPKKMDLVGHQGLEVMDGINNDLYKELGWGSHMLLTATAAATILVYWENEVLLKRGLISGDKFVPGDICKKSSESGKLVSLVKTVLYPGRLEFDTIVKDLPAVMVCPMGNDGWVILGGWSERCFTASDEKWLVGWTERITSYLENSIE